MGSLPDQVYLDEIPKLRAYPNIRTLGYVATHYADKAIEDVLAEIDIYARWPKLTNEPKMRVDVRVEYKTATDALAHVLTGHLP